MVRVTRKRAEDLLHQQQFTPRELADLLGTTEDFLMHEVWRGDLKALRFGEDIIGIKRHEILEWLERNESRAAR